MGTPTLIRENGYTRYELMLGIFGKSSHFIEQWESREHLALPHMREYFKKTHLLGGQPTG